MSDLISRKAVIDTLEKHYNDCKSSYEKTQGRAWEYMMLAYMRAIGEVKAIETTYDVDKVVEQLEVLKDCGQVTEGECDKYELGQCHDCLIDRVKLLLKGAVKDD
jgi:hypothetical protein